MRKQNVPVWCITFYLRGKRMYSSNQSGRDSPTAVCKALTQLEALYPMAQYDRYEIALIA